MSRRRRTRNRRSKGNSYWLIGLQVLVLTAVLVFLIFFRDYVSNTASGVLTGLSSDDLKVERQKEGSGEDDQGASSGSPTPSPDAGASSNGSRPERDNRETSSEDAGA